MNERPSSKGVAEVLVFEAGKSLARSDDLVTEEPLEIRLRASPANAASASLAVLGDQRASRVQRTVAVTMRTPGADSELAAGFLYGEGVIHERGGIERVAHCDDPGLAPGRRFNIVNVDLRSTALPDVEALQRHFHTTSACGVCGKTSLDSLRFNAPATISAGPIVNGRPRVRRHADRLPPRRPVQRVHGP